MGKVLESFGVIEGYDIIAISKMKVKKETIFEEIEKYDSNIKNDTIKIVNESSGKAFAIIKKGIIKGIYLFQTEIKDNIRILKHLKTVYTDEVSTDIRKKYDNHVLDFAKEYVTMREYNKIILDDKVIQIDPKKSKKEINISLIGGFAIGFLLGWIIFDELIWGLVYGLIFAPAFSGLEVVVNNKRGRKKKENNK